MILAKKPGLLYKVGAGVFNFQKNNAIFRILLSILQQLPAQIITYVRALVIKLKSGMET